MEWFVEYWEVIQTIFLTIGGTIVAAKKGKK